MQIGGDCEVAAGAVNRAGAKGARAAQVLPPPWPFYCVQVTAGAANRWSRRGATCRDGHDPSPARMTPFPPVASSLMCTAPFSPVHNSFFRALSFPPAATSPVPWHFPFHAWLFSLPRAASWAMPWQVRRLSWEIV